MNKKEQPTKVKGIEEAFAKHGVNLKQPKDLDLLTISRQQFEIKQEITKTANDIWKLKNVKLKHEQQYAKLEKLKDLIFIGMGLKVIKKEGKDEQ